MPNEEQAYKCLCPLTQEAVQAQYSTLLGYEPSLNGKLVFVKNHNVGRWGLAFRFDPLLHLTPHGCGVYNTAIEQICDAFVATAKSITEEKGSVTVGEIMLHHHLIDGHHQTQVYSYIS